MENEEIPFVESHDEPHGSKKVEEKEEVSAQAQNAEAEHAANGQHVNDEQPKQQAYVGEEPRRRGVPREISDDPSESFKGSSYGYGAGASGGAASSESAAAGTSGSASKQCEPRDDKKSKKAKKEKKPLTRGSAVGFGAIGTVVVLVIALVLWTCTPVLNFAKSSSGSSNGTITIENSEDATLAEAVSAKCIDSVVTIYVYSTSSNWNQYFNGGSSNSDSPSSLGSGVIVKVDGETCYILTNYHVIEDASKLTVSAAGSTYTATVAGSDSQTDLAVIKIKASGLTAMEWGDSTSTKVGEWVMAIGSPYGYEQTVTTGIVSALYRSDTISSSTSSSSTVYTDMIQTDAAINPGNSGGALVNSEGKLIGINTYISSSSQSSAGLGFAIPQAEAQTIADKLIAGQKVSHAYLGVTATDSSDPKGATVQTVYTGTPAQEAGLQQGDVITKVNDTTVESSSELTAAVTKLSAGDKAKFTYTRNGQENTVEVTLIERPTNDSSSSGDSNSGNGNGNNGYDDGSDSYGFDLEDLFNMFN